MVYKEVYVPFTCDEHLHLEQRTDLLIQSSNTKSSPRPRRLSATIKAPAGDVWKALRDFQSYCKWNLYTPTIDTPSGTNSIAVGDIITLHYRPQPSGNRMPIPCSIISLSDDEMSFCWRGEVPSIPCWIFFPEKVHRITPKGEGECLYEIFETQSGPMAYVVKWTMSMKLSVMNQGIADGLKAYVEGQQGS